MLQAQPNAEPCGGGVGVGFSPSCSTGSAMTAHTQHPSPRRRHQKRPRAAHQSRQRPARDTPAAVTPGRAGQPQRRSRRAKHTHQRTRRAPQTRRPAAQPDASPAPLHWPRRTAEQAGRQRGRQRQYLPRRLCPPRRWPPPARRSGSGRGPAPPRLRLVPSRGLGLCCTYTAVGAVLALVLAGRQAGAGGRSRRERRQGGARGPRGVRARRKLCGAGGLAAPRVVRWRGRTSN